MDLVERYLNAVAAQLPKEVREDIVAELRDEIMGRLEALEERLGRAPSDAEVEVLLRDVGHPLTVAARYRSGPQALIGPELYPWWWFAVKVALMVLVCVTVLGAVARVATGDVYLGQAFGQAISGFLSGAATLIGVLTAIGFVLERQEKKPKFISEWRVKDLNLFEIGNLDAETWSDRIARGDWSERTFSRGHEDRKSAQMSPVAGAVASAIGWTVLLLWWSNLTPIMPVRPENLAGVIGGVDYGAILNTIVAAAYWPVIVFAVARIGFDLARAATGSPVRLTALGDIGFNAATAALGWWLFFWSPLSPLIRVDAPSDFFQRVIDMFQGGGVRFTTILMICVVGGFISSAWQMVEAIGRLVAGQRRAA